MSATDTLTQPADVTRETKVSSIFETDTCSRCGGSGQMPFAVYAGKCFKCHGSGVTATKRGQAARAFYRQLVETPVEAIRPGDKVHYQGFQAGSYTQPSFWATVERVYDVAERAREAGSYEAAMTACGGCFIVSAEKAAELEAQGATVYEDPRDPSRFGVFSGLKIEAVQKNGERYSAGASRGKSELVALDPAVKVAILKTVAEYQLALTKAGKPRKDSRWG